MRIPLVLVTALAFATGGCLGAVEETVSPPPQAPAAPFALDCAIAPGDAVWPDPCTALASFNPSPAKTEIDLAVNPTDPLNVVVASKDLDRAASDCVWSVAQVTKDGGKTWKTVYVGGDLASRVPEAAPYNCVTDPIMVFDKNGVFYYALQAYDSRAVPHELWNQVAGAAPVPVPGGSAFILARSRDGGETFDKYNVQHVGDGAFVFHDYPRMLVNPKTQTVCAIWNGLGASGISPWVSCSRDGGESVDPPVTFYFEDAPRGTAFFSGFGATKDGTVYVTVAKDDAADSGATTDVYLWKSEDDARTFTPVAKGFAIQPTPRQFDGHAFRTPSFVELAVDATDGPHAGRLYTFWPEWANAQSDVLSRYSDDGGVTWSEAVNVATDAAGHELFMRPTVGPDGAVHVLFMTTSYAPEGTHLLDAVHAYSTDGGATWRNNRLTNSSFDGDKGVHQDGFPFIGDYNGIGTTPSGDVWLAWGDTRAGVAEIAVAFVKKA